MTGLSGFWRLLIVLYALVALRVLYATRAPEWNCVERRALAVLIVGAGLVVRWVYRGFKRQP